MKQYSQITFDFNDLSDSGENSGVGVRIKTLKKGAEEALKKSAEEAQKRSETEAAAIAAKASEVANINADLANIPTNDIDPLVDKVSAVDMTETDERDDAFDPHEDDRYRQNEYALESIPPNELQDGNSNSDTVISETEISQQDSGQAKTQKSTRGRKSLKTIDENADLINVPPDEELFKKQYYAIGEVAEMFHVNQSLLRFWETEFDIIQPRKNRKGDRHFRPVDIKNLLLIHDLLRRRKLTIEGAKDFLKKNKRSPERFAMILSLQKIKGFMLEIKAGL